MNMRSIKKAVIRHLTFVFPRTARTLTQLYTGIKAFQNSLWNIQVEKNKKTKNKTLIFTSFLLFICFMYITKYDSSRQISVQELYSAINKQIVTEIRIINLQSKTKNQEIQESKEKTNQEKTNQEKVKAYRVEATINSESCFAVIYDSELFHEICKQTSGYTNLKIFQDNYTPWDTQGMRIVKSISHVVVPLLFPFLLYRSSVGLIFKTKKIGQLTGFRPNVMFKDVAGLGDAKLEISELVDFLRNPEKYKKIGAKIPKGALLTGPPGTGKTLLAKACAGEAGVPFFTVSASEFVELFAGMGATKVRDLFKNAKKQTPSIVFIDEIDAIGRKREDKFGAGHDERANTLNQLLVQMDGFGTSHDVIVLAATNRKQMLDSALTRPGRFDRMVELQLPDIKGRQQILEIYLPKVSLSPKYTLGQYAKKIAALTYGFSGADLANLCNEAAIIAVRAKRDSVQPMDFENASDRVLAGLESHLIMSQEEKKRVAYHEAGHAVVAWYLEGAAPLLKVTIVPRSKGSLGFAQYLPNEAKLQNQIELREQLCVILGGRTAEEHFFNSVSNGAADDLMKIRKLSRMIVVDFGMSKKLMNYAPVQTDGENTYAEMTAMAIDQQIEKIIEETTKRTRKMVKKYEGKVTALAERLLEKETIAHEEIREVLGQRPFPPRENYKDFLEQSFNVAK